MRTRSTLDVLMHGPLLGAVFHFATGPHNLGTPLWSVKTTRAPGR